MSLVKFSHAVKVCLNYLSNYTAHNTQVFNTHMYKAVMITSQQEGHILLLVIIKLIHVFFLFI